MGAAFYTAADCNNGLPNAKTVNLGGIATFGITASDAITAAASDASGNTSEFTPAFVPTAANSLVAGRVTRRIERLIHP